MTAHSNNQIALEKVFDLEVVRVNLLLFSLYLTAFEILKSAITERGTIKRLL
jgi:hypothetical protein